MGCETAPQLNGVYGGKYGVKLCGPELFSQSNFFIREIPGLGHVPYAP